MDLCACISFGPKKLWASFPEGLEESDHIGEIKIANRFGQVRDLIAGVECDQEPEYVREVQQTERFGQIGTVAGRNANRRESYDKPNEVTIRIPCFPRHGRTVGAHPERLSQPHAVEIESSAPGHNLPEKFDTPCRRPDRRMHPARIAVEQHGSDHQFAIKAAVPRKEKARCPWDIPEGDEPRRICPDEAFVLRNTDHGEAIATHGERPTASNIRADLQNLCNTGTAPERRALLSG